MSAMQNIGNFATTPVTPSSNSEVSPGMGSTTVQPPSIVLIYGGHHRKKLSNLILFTAIFELAKTIYDTIIGDCPKKNHIYAGLIVFARGGCDPNSHIGSTVSVVVRAAHAHTLL
ncbi:hypothetical protein M9H77_35848 [Catharanthus roseus]|uniref:Uncharacterized protein n=1 Tax=Catharanthus roseus TaxID=4058 RepID=A0ACB9ZQX5_CATRO|nr:hypothetical protein M9H77_35848 [Catharanthus roseus]